LLNIVDDDIPKEHLMLMTLNLLNSWLLSVIWRN